MYFARGDYLSELVALDDAVEGEPENFAVEEEGAVLEVIKVVVEADEHLLKSIGIAVVEGGIGGDAGADGVEVGVARVALHYLLDEVGALGAGAYETHIAAQDVPELGELVEMVLADELADAGEACVVLLVVELGDAGGFGVGVHGAELIDAERLAAAADTLLGEKGRAAVVAAHENVADDEEGKEYDEAEDADDDVERAFDKVLCFIVEFLAVHYEFFWLASAKIVFFLQMREGDGEKVGRRREMEWGNCLVENAVWERKGRICSLFQGAVGCVAGVFIIFATHNLWTIYK